MSIKARTVLSDITDAEREQWRRELRRIQEQSGDLRGLFAEWFSERERWLSSWLDILEDAELRDSLSEVREELKQAKAHGDNLRAHDINAAFAILTVALVAERLPSVDASIVRHVSDLKREVTRLQRRRERQQSLADLLRKHNVSAVDVGEIRGGIRKSIEAIYIARFPSSTRSATIGKFKADLVELRKNERSQAR
jgi:DNA repair ATPase RecN